MNFTTSRYSAVKIACGMGDRGTSRLGSTDARDAASRAPAPTDHGQHRAVAAAAADGEEAHRAKLGHARRHKRPDCETPEHPAEEHSAVAVARHTAPRRRAGIDRETLETLIVREWTKTLRGPYDWGDWPLARYTLDARLLEALDRNLGISAQALARACAMVACGRAPRLRSLDPRERLDRDGQPLVRSDGATAWCCNLRRSALAGPQLYYWICPSGRIEFEAVAAPEEHTATQDGPWRG